MTEHTYLQHPRLFEISAVITATGLDDTGFYLILDHTLFYPQGGGQPADQGRVDGYPIYDVRHVGDEIRHYLDSEYSVEKSGAAVKIVVDRTRRDLNTRYHTAGHLLAAVAEGLSSEIRAVKGHQFPGEAYVEFDGMLEDEVCFVGELQKAIKSELDSSAVVKMKNLAPEDARAIAERLPYLLPKKTLRVCHIHGFAPMPCGGTHVYSLKEIGSVIITKCKSKKGRTRISYQVKN